MSAAIIAFPLAPRPLPRDALQLDPERVRFHRPGAELIIFPGVRIERIAECACGTRVVIDFAGGSPSGTVRCSRCRAAAQGAK